MFARGVSNGGTVHLSADLEVPCLQFAFEPAALAASAMAEEQASKCSETCLSIEDPHVMHLPMSWKPELNVAIAKVSQTSKLAGSI